MKILVKIQNSFGLFESLPIEIDEEEYPKILEMAKNFYLSGGYEMVTKNGFIVLPPDIVKQSILIIETLDDENPT
jgi:hypothetical protein